MTGNKRIIIDFVESQEQRYPTCGDYFEHEDHYHFKITKQNDPRKNLLILFHEMIEYTLCTDRDITEQEITDFDIAWNKKAEEVDDWVSAGIADEPGNQPGCPYYNEHRIAENFERQLAEYLGIDWFEYDRNLII